MLGGNGGKWRLEQIPPGHSGAVWLEPVVCTIENMPSDREGYRQAVFKGVWEDKLREECCIYPHLP